MLKKPHYIGLGLVVLLTLTLLSLPAQTAARLKLGLGAAFLPLFGVTQSTRHLTDKSVDALTPRRELLRQNDSLLRENQQLRIQSQRQESMERENQRLRNLVGWQRGQKWDLKLARVMARDPVNWWRTALIDFGGRNGARTNLPILTTEGLVGRVAQVYPTHSQIVLLGDANCKVSARVDNETRDTGIIGPAGPLDRDLVELSYLSRNAALKPGHKVWTSGDGGIFPRDILIGTVVDSYPVEYGLHMVARVKLAADPSRIDDVWVLISAAAPAVMENK